MSNSKGVIQQKASAIRKGGFIVINGRPCKVIDMSTSKTGKHGSAKVHFTATDIFTNKKMEELSPSTHNCDVPEVTRTEYQAIDISHDGFITLMLGDGSTREDMKCPEGEVGDQIKADLAANKDVFVMLQSAMGMEAIMTAKGQEGKD
eukprot:TRINITY_DN331_c0_g1_i1.p1 TRINITY_DN331_c0_g1~~TRINITY_DN331_c0_g1_i1.p1  ORF type:complete len:148 (-),score=28.86 TRINITY_DN331_c0_g1_i1:350-793(-)